MKTFLRLFIIGLVLTSVTFCTGTNNNKKGKMEEKKNPQYVISVKQGDVKFGDIVLELFPDVAPKHCHNFDSLVSIKFYDGTAFHRVIPGFMIQGGDPNSKSKPKETWGMGEPGQKTVPAEFNDISHERGILSAARTPDPNSATSQFFICVAAAPHLNKQYTVYGKVISGLEVVDKIVNVPRDSRDNPLTKVEMQITKKND
ncbi:MAG: peptidylprolyl isomerase [Ignavibacteriae bacterium]|nr:peptidylprolyl isomerase [Ignavibacteriota bacterium]